MLFLLCMVKLLQIFSFHLVRNYVMAEMFLSSCYTLEAIYIATFILFFRLSGLMLLAYTLEGH